MTHLGTHLERLGLEQYLDAFIAEGFDSWDTILDIQESDLDHLNVKLGHRRKLQRAIADARGIPYPRLLGSPARDHPLHASKSGETKPGDVYHSEGSLGEGQHADTMPGQGSLKESTSAAPAETKRKYRRHPKPDENAPEKPPSAYVLFSNSVREDIKSENLSFTEIAKLVGERWQKLDPMQKEPHEVQAHALKESYHIQLSAYKKTDAYKEYAQYLVDFKAKHGQTVESKRPRLDPQSSGGSASVASQEHPEGGGPVPTHVRGGSMGSISTTSATGPLPSPIALTTVNSLPSLPSTGTFSTAGGPLSGSPPTQYGRDRWRLGQMSTQSSMSDESTPVRGESHDPLARTATLSLNTPPAVTPPLTSNAPTLLRAEHNPSLENLTWQPSRQVHQPLLLTNPHGNAITLPSPTPAMDPRRDRPSDSLRSAQTTPMPTTGFPGSLPLPPIINPDRLPDLNRVQVQRTLPPPLRQYPTGSPAQPAFPPPQLAVSQGHLGSWPALGVERHDSEAATTLAALASRRENDHNRRHRDPRS